MNKLGNKTINQRMKAGKRERRLCNRSISLTEVIFVKQCNCVLPSSGEVKGNFIGGGRSGSRGQHAAAAAAAADDVWRGHGGDGDAAQAQVDQGAVVAVAAAAAAGEEAAAVAVVMQK